MCSPIIKFPAQNNGKNITWEHIKLLYHNICGAQASTIPGLSLVPKLKYEHIFLGKMKVDLAAQVHVNIDLC